MKNLFGKIPKKTNFTPLRKKLKTILVVLISMFLLALILNLTTN